jgi:hypothetical protein
MILKSFKFSCCNVGLSFVSYPAKSFIGQTGMKPAEVFEGLRVVLDANDKDAGIP